MKQFGVLDANDLRALEDRALLSLTKASFPQAGVASAYGAAGSLAAVLVWCYASAQIFLYGACVMYVQQAAREGRGSDGKPIARHCVADGRLHPADPES